MSYEIGHRNGKIFYRKKRKIGWKISLEGRGHISASKKGSQNPMWTTGKPSYAAVHLWLNRNYKRPKRCEKCKKIKRLDLANKDGRYLRDIKNYRWLCRRCHMVSDGRLLKLRATRIPKTTCIKGHPYTEANTGRTKLGQRYCRKCRIIYGAWYRSVHKQKDKTNAIC